MSHVAFNCSRQMCLVGCKFRWVLFCENVKFCDIFLDEKRGLQSNFGFDLLKIEGHNY